jgi:hypothetical protein
VLALITLFISIHLLFAWTNRSLLFHPDTPLGWCFLVLYLGTLFCLVCAWGHAFMSVTFEHESTKSEIPKGEAKKTGGEPDCSDSVSDDRVVQQYQDQLQSMATVITVKTTNLHLTYSELTISAWWFAGLVSVGILIEVGGF